MPVQIGALPDAGYDQPIGMLRDCHRRIRHFVGIFEKVAREAKGYLLNSEQQGAVQAAIRYFRTSGTMHSRDEEESLFPRLKEQTPAAVVATIARLEAEHRKAEMLHRRVEELYQNWMAEFGLNGSEEEELIAAAAALVALYQSHIEIEEGVVFSAAESVLDSAEQSAIGKEFAARRLQLPSL